MTEKLSTETNEKFQQIEENIKRIRENIESAAEKSGRKAQDIRFMAVTKTVQPVYINHALGCGIDLIGENKVQEFLSKRDELNLDGCEKHLIGHLQTNKVHNIVGQVDMIESVDSVHLAEEIGKQSRKLNITTKILIEINIGDELSKSGIEKETLPETAEEISKIKGVKIEGLMAIPPVSDDINQTRSFFSEMRKLFIDMRGKKIDNIDMNILSMGMSADYAAAIEEGSNLVRIGSAIFGQRIYKN